MGAGRATAGRGHRTAPQDITNNPRIAWADVTRDQQWAALTRVRAEGQANNTGRASVSVLDKSDRSLLVSGEGRNPPGCSIAVIANKRARVLSGPGTPQKYQGNEFLIALNKPLEVMNLEDRGDEPVVTDLVRFQASVRDRRAWKAWSGPVLLSWASCCLARPACSAFRRPRDVGRRPGSLLIRVRITSGSGGASQPGQRGGDLGHGHTQSWR